MINTLLLVVTVSGDTTVVRTDSSKDIQFGRDKVTSYLLTKVGTLGCKTFTIKDDVTMDGTLYVWTGTLKCSR